MITRAPSLGGPQPRRKIVGRRTQPCEAGFTQIAASWSDTHQVMRCIAGMARRHRCSSGADVFLNDAETPTGVGCPHAVATSVVTSDPRCKVQLLLIDGNDDLQRPLRNLPEWIFFDT
jgi:hypothetical protein